MISKSSSTLAWGLSRRMAWISRRLFTCSMLQWSTKSINGHCHVSFLHHTTNIRHQTTELYATFIKFIRNLSAQLLGVASHPHIRSYITLCNSPSSPISPFEISKLLFLSLFFLLVFFFFFSFLDVVNLNSYLNSFDAVCSVYSLRLTIFIQGFEFRCSYKKIVSRKYVRVYF